MGLKNKAEFIEHCVLQLRLTPADAVQLWKDTQKTMWEDWTPPLKTDPGPFLQAVWEMLDSVSDSTRRTFFGLIRERYSEWTGTREESRRW